MKPVGTGCVDGGRAYNPWSAGRKIQPTDLYPLPRPGLGGQTPVRHELCPRAAENTHYDKLDLVRGLEADVAGAEGVHCPHFEGGSAR